MADNVLGLIFEIHADPTKAEAALEATSTKAALAFGAIGESGRRAVPHLKEASSAVESLSRATTTAFEGMSSATRQWGDLVGRAFGTVANLLLRHTEMERRSAIETGKSESEKSLLTIKAIRETAAVRAVTEAAKGFAALADYDFWSAAQHFTASALFGAVAAMQIAAALGAGGGGRHRSARSTEESDGSGATAGGNVPLAFGAASATSVGSANGGGQVTVMVVGESRAATWIAAVLNRHVEHQGGRLVSSHTRRPAPAGA